MCLLLLLLFPSTTFFGLCCSALAPEKGGGGGGGGGRRRRSVVVVSRTSYMRAHLRHIFREDFFSSAAAALREIEVRVCGFLRIGKKEGREC